MAIDAILQHFQDYSNNGVAAMVVAQPDLSSEGHGDLEIVASRRGQYAYHCIVGRFSGSRVYISPKDLPTEESKPADVCFAVKWTYDALAAALQNAAWRQAAGITGVTVVESLQEAVRDAAIAANRAAADAMKSGAGHMYRKRPPEYHGLV